MKKIIILIFLALIPSIASANTYIDKMVGGFKFRVIKYDLSSDIYDIKVVKTDDSTNLSNLLKQNNAITGVNGVFFCPTDYSWCNTTKSFSDNERYIQGEKFATYFTTGDRAVFGWTQDKVPFIYQSGKINIEDEDKIYYGLGNYPLLLNEGKNMLEEYWDKGLIDNKMRVKGTRNFICSDKEKKNIYFGLVYNATIDELAGALGSFGCYDALNLDAGLSTVFMYNNRYLVGPQKRDILDAVVVERKGVDVSQITEIGDKIANVITQDIDKKNKSQSGAIKNTNKYIDALNELRIRGYNKYSTPIIEQNIVGENEEVGYQIEINDLRDLKLILTINEVSEKLKTYKSKLEGKIYEDETIQAEAKSSSSHKYTF